MGASSDDLRDEHEEIDGSTTTSSAFHRVIFDRYVAGTPLAQRSAHELFGTLEFTVRFLGILANSALRADDAVAAPKIARGGGLGTWVAYVRDCQARLALSRGEGSRRVLDAVDSLLIAYDGGLRQGGDLGVPQSLRNHLLHGGPVPPLSDISAPIATLIEIADGAIGKCLETAELIEDSRDPHCVRPTLIWDVKIPLWPLVYRSGDGSWKVFASANGAKLIFHSYGTEEVQANSAPPGLGQALARVLTPIRNSPEIGRFRKDVLSDLRGFSEVGDLNYSVSETDQGFEVWWRKAIGTGEGYEERRDWFRIGPDGVRQWRQEAGWLPYSAYLRELANWPLVARRIGQSLAEVSRRLSDEERLNLGWTSASEVEEREVVVTVSGLDGSDAARQTFSDLIGALDSDLEAHRPQTQVVFINGEAGVGKTRAMIAAATKRSADVEQILEMGPGAAPPPLFLYVGSTGQVLSQLDQVVAAAVSSTRTLTAEAVKALCRNGLMALFVDGFDELLGNVRYADALGSLRPWLEDLGGRGVLVVSARSSYYLGQYKASVQSAGERDELAVVHRVADIHRWDAVEVRSVLEAYGVDPLSMETLEPHDRELLRLPFFARAFIELSRGSVSASVQASLTERLLEQYLAREEAKIVREDGTSVITRAELREMFAYVAELMDENSEREADDELLRTAAMFAIGEPIEARSGLSERLPALCGLAVDAGGLQRRFRFQHEVFFDEFLGIAVRSNIVDGVVTPHFHQMIGLSVWQSATVKRVVTDLPHADLARVLTGALGRGDGASRTERATAAANAGSLWEQLLARSHTLEHVVRHARFVNTLDLRDHGSGTLRLLGCDIERLILPAGSDWRVELNGSTVRRIELTSSMKPGQLCDLDVRPLLEVLTPSELLERTQDIAVYLAASGATLVGVQADGVVRESLGERAATHFLRRAVDRGEYSWILRKNHRVPDEDIHVKRATEDVYGRDAWTAFVNALVACGLASEEPITGSGAAKVRVRLRVGATYILERNVGKPEVAEFWSRVS